MVLQRSMLIKWWYTEVPQEVNLQNEIIINMRNLGGGLASDDLYLLDLKDGEDKATWSIVGVVGPTPGRRYGHTLVFAKPFLVVFGGNTGEIFKFERRF